MARQRFAFILRLWQEAPARSADLRPQLRGSLQPIDSEDVYYFDSFSKIPEILRTVTQWQDVSGKNSNQEKE